MIRRVIHTSHAALAAMMVLTGVVPVAPASLAAPAQPAGRVEEVYHAGVQPNSVTEGTTVPSDPVPTEPSSLNNPESAQDGGFIDPGPYWQGSPSATADSHGNTYLVWMDDREGVPLIRFAQRPAGADWGASVQLDSSATVLQLAPRIAVDGAGNLYAVWEDYRDAESQIYFAYRPSGGDWGASQPISPTAQAQDRPSLAVNHRGEAVVSWRQGAVSDYNVFSAKRPASGGWGAAERRTAAGGNVGTTDVDIDDWGRVYLAWEDWDQGQIWFAVRSPDGLWGADEPVRDSTTDWTWGIQVAADSAGNVHAVWEDARGAASDIYAAYRPAGGSWSTNVRIDDQGEPALAPGLGVDGAGNAVAAWTLPNQAVYSSVRYLGSDWTPSQLLSEGTSSQAVLPMERGGYLRQLGREMRPGSRTGPLDPQAIESFTPAVVLGAAVGLIISIFTEPVHGNSNVYTADVGSPGGNGCRNAMATQASARSQVLTPRGPAQGDAGVCRAGNGGQEPALNGDESQNDSQSPPEGRPEGGWPIETRIVDGQTVYVVDTPGQDMATTDPNQVLKFSQNYVYQPSSGDDADQAGQVSSDSSAGGVDPSAGDANSPVADQGSPDGGGVVDGGGEPDSPPDDGGDETPSEQQRDAGPPAWCTHYANAMSLLDDYHNETDADARKEITRRLSRPEHAQFLVASPADLSRLFNRMEQLPDRYRTPNVTWLAQMSPEGFAALRRQVDQLHGLSEAEARQREAEWRAKQREQRAQSSGGTQRVSAIGAIQNHQDRINAELGPRLLNAMKEGNNNKNALERGREFREEQIENIKPEIVRQGRGVVEQTYDLANSDPVFPHSGEFVHRQTALFIPGRGMDYAFRLNYHSQLIYDGPVGWGWEHTYDRLIVPAGGGSLALREGAGRFDVYSFDGTDFTPPAGRYTSLVSTTTGITITDRWGNVEGYYPLDGSPAAGHLRSRADRNDNTMRFAYDGQGRLETVTDTLGRAITYTYNADDRITAVTDYTGRAVLLDYDVNGDLVSITTPAVTGTPNQNDFPAGKTTVFSYTSGFEDLRLNHNLTTIIDPNEVEDGSLTPRTINTYGEEGFDLDRVVRQSWGGGRSNDTGIPAGGDVTFVYTTTIAADAPAGAASKTTIIDRGDNPIELWHDGAGHRLRTRRVVDSQELLTDYTYNADGLITRVTYPAGSRIDYVYDDGAADHFARGNLLETRHVADPARGCDGLGSAPCPDLVTSYTYEPNFQQLESVTSPNGNTTTNEYDTRGNLLRMDLPDVTVGPVAPQTAFQTWTYNADGQPLTFTDAEGNTTCYAYYDSGPATGYRKRVTRDCGGLDLTTEYAYDGVGNVTVITDARGVRTEYTYNTLDQVVHGSRATTVPEAAAFTALDYETRYWYDANDNLIRMDVENVAANLDGDVHPTGTHSRDAANPWFTTQYTYDLLNNVVRVTAEVTASRQVTTEYRYDPLERPISATLPEGNRITYAYDGRHLLRAITWGVGSTEVSTTTYDYDANANLVRLTDGEGHRTDFLYDGFGRQVGQVDALGNLWIWRYDPGGNRVETIVRDGQDGRNPTRTITATTAITLAHSTDHFDERGRRYLQRRAFFIADVDSGVITPLTTDADGDGWVETATGYDRKSRMAVLIDDDGNTTSFAYDGLDRLVLLTDTLSNTVAYTFDSSGNVVQSVATERQPDGLAPADIFTTTNAFDGVNRLIQTTDTLGQTSRYAYDSHANVIFTSDPNGPVAGASNDHGNTAAFTYDGLNRLLEETYHLREGGAGSGAVVEQVTTSYAYDDNGNLTRITDPNGNVTRYSYDALDRITGATYADGTADASTYDRAHNLVQRTDANGSVITHTYDDLNRRVRSDVTRAPGVGGTTLQTFAWDGLSRMVGASDDNDPDVPSDDNNRAFSYDSLSNRRTETQDGHMVSATFDGVGNRLSLTYPGGTVLTYTHDALNRVTSIADASGELARYAYIGPRRVLSRTGGNGTYTTYAFDALGRVTEIAHRLSSNDALLTGFSYTYDRGHNRTSESALHSGKTVSYTYDSLYRLNGVQGPSSKVEYTYDAAGNRDVVTDGSASKHYTANQVHAYESINGETRTHDANGNLLSRHFTVEAVLCTALDGVTAAGPPTTTVGVAATFTASVTPTNADQPITYTWNVGEGAQQQVFTHTGGLSDTLPFAWSVTGTQMVTVTANNRCGVAVSATHPITVEAMPCTALEEVTATGPPTTTVGVAATFTASVTPTDADQPITYTWNVGEAVEQQVVTHTGGLSDTLTFAWSITGTQMVSVTANNPCGVAVSDSLTITVESPPPSCPYPLQAVGIAGATGGYTDAPYDFAAVITPTGATPSITYTWTPEPESGQGSPTARYRWTTPGAYTITLQAENCGGAVSDTHAITISVELDHHVYLPLVMMGTAATLTEAHDPIAPGPSTLDSSTVVTETLIHYQYDVANRLVGVTTWITVTEGEDVDVISATLDYTYDALGHRLTTQSEGGTVRYIYTGGWVIEERDEGDALTATYAAGLTMDRGEGRVFYQTDALGSTRALTDESGDLLERVDYHPFGTPTFGGGAAESDADNPYLFRGRRYDAEPGLYVYGGRRYEPATGRYTQRGAGTLSNPYTFAGNNPVGARPR